MIRRRVLYWALWPLEKALDLLGWLWRVSLALIIVSNPVFLAMWILGRDKRRREEDK
ncbi:hypothetical protein ES703_112603 [subsurface metagenome]